ncbi:putative ribonuclease H-like domain-containing protein [Tanacetum coccineum]|uniref:Ribonuclease H-like domain-containing protein n=1 Tax=Tanacetum coccineum TaxID=301880 RepID=A0ABQ5B5F3_9ASTR
MGAGPSQRHPRWVWVFYQLFDRDDLVMLWNLVEERFSSTEPTDDKERTLWVELKRERNRYFHAGREKIFLVKRSSDFDVENGNSFKPAAKTTTNTDGTSTTLIPGLVTTEEKVQKKNDMKEGSMLLMALPNEHLMTFNQYKDAKTLFAAIQTRFGVWRNKPDLDTMSFGDLYNNFKIVEQEVKGTASSSSSSNSQNMAFMSSPSSTKEVNIAYEVSTANIQVSPTRTQVSIASTQLALLSMRTRRFFQKTGRKITINGSDIARYDKSKVECFNCHKMGHFEREYRGPRNQDSRNMNQDNSRRTINVEETSSKAIWLIDLLTSKNVSEDTSNEVRESPDTPMVEKLVSDNMLEKKTVFPTVAKIEFVRPKQQEKPVRKPVKPRAVNTVRPNSAVVNVVKAKGNMSYLSDFKEFDGGYVTFGGGAKGGKITSKGTLKTGKLDFEDVYFVKELQFNLFSVSQMCDKKNSVLFTDTGCFVLSPDFKLADESQVLLKVPRKNNMYSVDMKNIVPKESLTCLVAKATLDESMLWHRRLGHVNFKTINKLVKDNLVRGLPSKRFENDQTCVACLNGKQHKASCDGPKWLFDIDVLTKSMIKCQLMQVLETLMMSVGTNKKCWYKSFYKETVSSQTNILMPLSKDGSLFDSSSKNTSNDEPQPSSDAGKKDDEGIRQESGIDDQERPKKSTQDVNTAGPSINTASTNVNTSILNINTVSLIVTTTPLEATHADFFGDETEVDMSNITTTYPVPSTPNIRIHKDHSLDHVIGDIQSGVLTRRMTKASNEQGFISAIYEGKTHEDLHTCLFACFLSQVEPKKVIQALTDPSWIEAMQDELLFQVTPKVSHLHTVKRMFRYLKGQPKLGLWYPKDSPFDLEAYTDSDYVGASLDRKSTTGGCQFLGSKLISWQYKKQTIVCHSNYRTNSSFDNKSTICIVKNPVFYSKTKHIEIRHHFIKDSNEKKLIQMKRIHTDQNVTDFLTKAFDVGRFQYLIATEYAQIMLETAADDAIQVSAVGLTYYCTARALLSTAEHYLVLLDNN